MFSLFLSLSFYFCLFCACVYTHVCVFLDTVSVVLLLDQDDVSFGPRNMVANSWMAGPLENCSSFVYKCIFCWNEINFVQL